MDVTNIKEDNQVPVNYIEDQDEVLLLPMVMDNDQKKMKRKQNLSEKKMQT